MWTGTLFTRYGEPEAVYSLMLELGALRLRRGWYGYFLKPIGVSEGLDSFDEGGRWVLYAVFQKYSIPFYLLGDGLRQAFTYLALLAGLRDSVVLAEEPELHQHPRSLELVAKAVAYSRAYNGNQVFVSTHSLEFLDMVLEAVREEGVEGDLVVYRLHLRDGILSYRRYSYEEARKLRHELELDLRG